MSVGLIPWDDANSLYVLPHHGLTGMLAHFAKKELHRRRISRLSHHNRLGRRFLYYHNPIPFFQYFDKDLPYHGICLGLLLLMPKVHESLEIQPFPTGLNVDQARACTNDLGAKRLLVTYMMLFGGILLSSPFLDNRCWGCTLSHRARFWCLLD